MSRSVRTPTGRPCSSQTGKQPICSTFIFLAASFTLAFGEIDKIRCFMISRQCMSHTKQGPFRSSSMTEREESPGVPSEPGALRAQRVRAAECLTQILRIGGAPCFSGALQARGRAL